MVHDYNPSYSGGRDQEDHGSKPVWKKKITKIGLVKWLDM
jgi:hypothetical protein